MKYPDTVRLATTTVDGYGDKTVTILDEVQAAFVRRAGISHGSNTEGETSDAAVYLAPNNAVVLNNKDNLEGMYILAEPFSDENWYKISSANIAERKLLNNAIDNIYCKLEKVAGMAYVVR